MTTDHQSSQDRRRNQPLRAVRGLNTYRVRGDDPRLEVPFIADLVASSEAAAISRCRGTAFHLYRTPAVFDWDWTVVTWNPGIDFDLGEV